MTSRSCRTCGWSGTYPTTKKADWAKRVHSCQRRLKKAAAAERGRRREAAVDRTPKPCHHKQAQHQHGTSTCYVLDRCRCIPCMRANTVREAERTRLKAYGRYDKYVDAEPIREHLAQLKAYGIGLKTVAKMTGVGNGTLTKIWYGTYATTGRGKQHAHGTGEFVRGQSRRVQRTTADRILAVQAIPANLGPRQLDHERTALARTHLRALVAMGWSMSEIGVQLGMRHRNNACSLITCDTVMARETVDKAEALFAKLAMTPPPEGNQRERISGSRARKHAREHGWLPPLALDDLVDEDLEVGPDVDEVLVYRVLNGDWQAAAVTNAAERREICLRWYRRGGSAHELAKRAGWKPERYARVCEVIAS